MYVYIISSCLYPRYGHVCILQYGHFCFTNLIIHVFITEKREHPDHQHSTHTLAASTFSARSSVAAVPGTGASGAGASGAGVPGGGAPGPAGSDASADVGSAGAVVCQRKQIEIETVSYHPSYLNENCLDRGRKSLILDSMMTSKNLTTGQTKS